MKCALRCAAVLAAVFLPSITAHAACRYMVHNTDSFRVCDFDTQQDTVTLRNLDRNGRPFGDFLALDGDLNLQKQKLLFAMNAGMFGTDLKPIGLYVEGAKQFRELNRAGGSGNFHLKPNGVFYIVGNKAGVLDSDAYSKSGIKPDYATQSGPMLVVNGAVHPKLSPDGTSAKLRNGVCVTESHNVHFAISEEPVIFYSLASLFLEKLNCQNALFFDGSVSAIYSAETGSNTQLVPLGPMVAVTTPAN